MALYDYQCQECGVVFEESLPIDDRKAPTEKPCFKCGEGEIRLLISAPSIGDPVRLGVTKPSVEFNDVMQKIKKGHPLGQFQKSTSRYDYDVSRRNEAQEKFDKKLKDIQ